MAEASLSMPQDTGSEAVANGLTNGVTNGTTNDHSSSSDRHKHSSSDKHKSSSRDKDRHSSSHKSSNKDRDKDKDRHKSSSSSTDKHKSSDKDKERSSDKDKHRSSDKDKHRSSSSSGDKDRHRDKDKDRHKSNSSSSRDKDKEHSSSKDKDKEHSKDKERSDKDKERSEKDKERSDRDKERSNDKERSDKDKERSNDKERSDKDKERSDKDKERRDKERSSDKDKHRSSSKHSSSSSGDKHRSSTSDKDRDRHRDDKDKHRSSSSGGDKKDRDRHSSSSRSSHKDKHRDKDRHREKDRNKEHKDCNDSSIATADVPTTAMAVVKQEHLDSSLDTSINTTQESSYEPSLRETASENNVSAAADTTEEGGEGAMADTTDAGGASAGESEEDNQLFIHVKEETQDTSATHAADQEEMMDTSYVVKKEEPLEEPMDDEEDDDVSLSTRKVKEESDEDYKAEESEDDDVPLTSRKTKREPSDDEDDVPLSARKQAVKEEPVESDDDVPLAARKKIKKQEEEGDDDDVPLAARRKSAGGKKKRKKPTSEDEDDDDFKPQKAKKAKVKKEKKTPAKSRRGAAEAATPKSPTKKVKKESEEEKNVWKWWEEDKTSDGRKWTTLEHKGVLFAEPYERLPSNIQLKYDGKYVELSQDSEEVAGFYARMLEHDYVTKAQFNKNFFKDFRKVMTSKERDLITDLTLCDFKRMYAYFVGKNEERKSRSKEEKKALKEKNEEYVKEYGWCVIDGHKQRIANFRAEPPGLFRGRGDHPKMGMLKMRIQPEHVIINISKDVPRPPAPSGHHWKEVRHDNQVTWLASWTENVQGQTKYVMVNAASKLKGEKDWQKYETARQLHQIAHRIRDQYRSDWKSKEMRIRQRSVALYFIDKLALRAGNEKDEDQADTVGCCSLRVEHITLHEEKDGKECVVAFDFLGKDSIRYYNEVPVEKRAFKNVKLFMENKAPADDLFDRLNTQIMNKHLNELMEGLTAKVFRTYNASRTLQEQLIKLTDYDDDLVNKVLSYNRANREVAILCNHQRAVPKTYDQSMANLQKKIDEKKDLIDDCEKDLKTLKRQAKSSMAEKTMYEKKKKHVERLNEQLHKLEISATDKEENKQIALGTSKLNYLDPRISVAWCKKYDVPIEKVYNKTQRLKFQWALEMATEGFNFMEKPTSTLRIPVKDESVDNDEEPEDDIE